MLLALPPACLPASVLHLLACMTLTDSDWDLDLHRLSRARIDLTGTGRSERRCRAMLSFPRKMADSNALGPTLGWWTGPTELRRIWWHHGFDVVPSRHGGTVVS